MKINNMEKLKDNSFRVYPGTEERMCARNKYCTIPTEKMKQYSGKYCSNNNVLCFVDTDYDRTIYVLPYKWEVEKLLKNAGFTRAGFYVPFSNWSEPGRYKDKEIWEKVRQKFS